MGRGNRIYFMSELGIEGTKEEENHLGRVKGGIVGRDLELRAFEERNGNYCSGNFLN